MTQNELVLAELKAGERLTSLGVVLNDGITRLAARIYDLRRAGWNIRTEIHPRRRYAIYRLGRPHRRPAP